MHRRTDIVARLGPLLAVALLPALLGAQETEFHEGEQEPREPLTRLVREALARSPLAAAARADARALRARVPRAGAWEDPTLTFGFVNLRTTSFDFGDDFMTMKVLQLGQTVPLPGQIGNRKKAALLQAEAGEHVVEGVLVRVASEMKRAYAELYYRDRALEIVDRNLAILRGLEEVTRTRYTTGVGRQPAVLRAGLEIDALEAQRVALTENRRSALARVNALRDRPPDTAVDSTPFPPNLLALLSSGKPETAFAAALAPERGMGAAKLPPPDSLISLALERRPDLRAHVARIRAQERAVELARAQRWPAPRFAVGYGQRDGFADMLNATVSFSIPVFLGAKQNAAVREEAAVLAREQSRHDEMVRQIEREVTDAYAAVADAIGRLALYEHGILTRAEANLEATVAAYRSGAEDFLALLDSQTSLYRHQLDYHRRLADLLAAWADLEQAVGEQIEP